MAGSPEVLGFGIVGCGVIAPTHADVLASIPNARLVAATDVVPEKASAFARKYGASAEPDLGTLLARDDVDVITVCVPSGLHAEVAVRAAQAGKHLVVEKPIDITVEAADRIIAAARGAGVTLTVISQHRFDPGVLRARELVDQGRLGRLVLGEATVKWYRSQAYYDSAEWRGTWALDGGGALMNQAVHYVDLLRWMMGPVDEVSALCTTQTHSMEAEDVALATVRFSSGAVGMLQASTSVYPGFPERLEISGTAGTVVVEAGVVRHEELLDERGEVGAYGSTVKALPETPAIGSTTTGDVASGAADPAAIGGNAHRAQIVDFLDALSSGRPPAMTGEAARDAVAVIRAVYASAREGRPVRPEQGRP